jgi:type I restriction enzyme S subunit
MLPILNNTYISGYKIAVPPLSEQQRIADYLDERCAAIDSVIDTRTRQLERLDDYRRALIFAYVTGKKEVPTDE